MITGCFVALTPNLFMIFEVNHVPLFHRPDFAIILNMSNQRDSLIGKNKDLQPIPRTHVKMPCVVACLCNPSMGERETKRF